LLVLARPFVRPSDGACRIVGRINPTGPRKALPDDRLRRNPPSWLNSVTVDYALMSFVKYIGKREQLHALLAGVDGNDDRATVGTKPETSVIKL
jgi:hypothetical protein